MNIPVTFSRHGKNFTGVLHPVSGGGGMFHLMINKFYQGCLIKTDNGWQFSTQKEGVVKELGDHFGKEVEKFLVKKY